MTNDINRCKYYQAESQNVKGRWMCMPPPEYVIYAKKRNLPIPIDKESCEVMKLLSSLTFDLPLYYNTKMQHEKSMNKN